MSGIETDVASDSSSDQPQIGFGRRPCPRAAPDAIVRSKKRKRCLEWSDSCCFKLVIGALVIPSIPCDAVDTIKRKSGCKLNAWLQSLGLEHSTDVAPRRDKSTPAPAIVVGFAVTSAGIFPRMSLEDSIIHEKGLVLQWNMFCDARARAAMHKPYSRHEALQQVVPQIVERERALDLLRHLRCQVTPQTYDHYVSEDDDEISARPTRPRAVLGLDYNIFI